MSVNKGKINHEEPPQKTQCNMATTRFLKKKLQLFLTPFSSKIEGKAKMISHGLAIACGLINNKVYPAKNMLCNL